MNALVLLLVAVVAGFAGAGITAIWIRCAGARVRRYLDGCAAARVLDLTTLDRRR